MENYTLEPSFSILLPVKNGGNYLHTCAESILKQTYQNFELVILENQSDDDTVSYINNLALKDSRVKIISTERPLSIEDNWARIYNQTKKDYMTIIGHDDILEPNFLEEVRRCILEEPSATLYQTHFRLIDASGAVIRQCMPIPKHESAAEFLAARLSEIRDSFGTGYVMKSELYDYVGGIPLYPNLLFSDDALWLKLIGKGIKVTSSQVCFSYRLHAKSTSGKPDHKALFYALKQYHSFLKKLGNDDIDIDNAINQYSKNYIAKRCHDYYYNILLHNFPWTEEVNNEVVKIEKLLSDIRIQSKADENYLAFTKKSRWYFIIFTTVKKTMRRITSILFQVN